MTKAGELTEGGQTQTANEIFGGDCQNTWEHRS